MPKPKKKLTEKDLLARLRKKFEAPRYAFFSHVRSKLGFSSARTIDGLAMGTWQSTGLEIHGFEVKTSRSDWLRELKKPEKSEAIARFCDRFWLVVADADHVQPGELPPAWGLLAASGRGLKRVHEAPRVEPEPISRAFLAAILRRADDPDAERQRQLAAKSAARAEVQKELSEAREARAKLAAYESANSLEGSRLEAVKIFEEASGLSFLSWNGETLRTQGALLRALRDAGPAQIGRARHGIERSLARLEGLVGRLKVDLEHIPEDDEGLIARLGLGLEEAP